MPLRSELAWAEWAGWAAVRSAKVLVGQQKVVEAAWNAPVATGLVREVAAGEMAVRVQMRSSAWVETRCDCALGKTGRPCVHAVAVLMVCEQKAVGERAVAVAKAAAAAEAATKARVKARSAPGAQRPTGAIVAPGDDAVADWPRSLVRAAERGKVLRLRLLIPPNLSATAPRDAIVVRLEAEDAQGRVEPADQINRGLAYSLSAPEARLAAWLEHWNGGRLPGYLRLTRAQLRTALAEVVGTDRVRWVNLPNAPLRWQGEQVEGVHRWLEAVAPRPSSATGPATGRLRPTPGDYVAPADRESVRRAGAGGLFGGGPARAVEAEGFRRAQVHGSTQFLAVTLPDRSDPSYAAWLELVKGNSFSLEPSNRQWWLRDRHKVLTFLARHESELRGRLGAVFSEGLEAKLTAVARASVVTEVATQGDDFLVSVRLAAGAATEEQMRDAVVSGRTWIEVGDQVVLLPPAQVEALAAAQRRLSGQRDRPPSARFEQKMRGAQLTDAEAVLAEISPEFRAPSEWRQRSAALGDFSRLPNPPLPAALEGQLRLYQRIGVAWLWHLYNHGLGGLLADEMGLGKTIQAIGLLQAVRANRPEAGPALVTCPAGLVENWRRELARFAPALRVAVHHGGARATQSEELDGADVVLTSDATLARDADLLAAIDWGVVVADEAQHLKNRRTQMAQALRRLRAPSRFVLTGTPVENRLDDLRSLFEFLLPGYLAPVPGGLRGEEKIWYDDRHRQQAAPYILRRQKTLVAPELPERIEQTIYCELSPRQRQLYEEVRLATEQELGRLEAAGVTEGHLRMAVFTQLLRLRQVCAEPRVLREDWDPVWSAKREALLELLDEAMDDDHRVLVFSSFTQVLTILRRDLEQRGIVHAYLDGSMTARDRQAQVDRFQSDPEVRVFLLSLKAGGVGLNLTGADTVVHFDPWWNPAAEAQATDRAHRIGQAKVVTSLRLIAAGTVEEKVLDLQDRKRALLQAVWDETEAATGSVSLADLRELVK